MAETETKTEATETVETTDDQAKLVEANRKKGRENKSLRAKLAEQDADLERLRKLESDMQTETEKAIADARAEGAAEATTLFESKMLGAKIEARAATLLADPTDAVLVATEGLSVDDVDGIDDALKALIKSKPHLAARPSEGKKIDQGPRGTVTGKPGGDGPDAWLRGEIDAKL